MFGSAYALARSGLLRVTLALLLVVPLSGVATADVCSSLRAQLNALGRPGGTTARGSAREIQKLRTQALWGGCLPGGPPVAIRRRDCPALLARLRQLQGGRPAPQLFGAASPRQIERQRTRLLRALASNGCDGGSDGDAWRRGTAVWGRNFRTLCVRTCDGYYFPIGTATPRSRLKFDEAACKSMYFGQAAELYVQVPGSATETARTLKGKPYTALPTAFQYRSEFDGSCAAALHDGLKALAGIMPTPKIAVQQAPAKVARKAKAATRPGRLLQPMPLPVLRATFYEDPETQANAGGNFTVGGDDGVVVVAPPGMRKLGPAYYYADRGPNLFAHVVKWKKPPPSLFEVIGTAAAAETIN